MASNLIVIPATAPAEEKFVTMDYNTLENKEAIDPSSAPEVANNFKHLSMCCGEEASSRLILNNKQEFIIQNLDGNMNFWFYYLFVLSLKICMLINDCKINYLLLIICFYYV